MASNISPILNSSIFQNYQLFWSFFILLLLFQAKHKKAIIQFIVNIPFNLPFLPEYIQFYIFYLIHALNSKEQDFVLKSSFSSIIGKLAGTGRQFIYNSREEFPNIKGKNYNLKNFKVSFQISHSNSLNFTSNSFQNISFDISQCIDITLNILSSNSKSQNKNIHLNFLEIYFLVSSNIFIK
ncbi:hypothetical protein M0811_14012 [Anaeramoeba ignava]|uniref:Transmembrane protein n=1 Tax=Anaeramoeba ignava TaxID=1746090 RepID=A0A9Q0LX23_ANAIG|nr:hypothetical protein M0811_14012 [Anaeramoeba ignava]